MTVPPAPREGQGPGLDDQVRDALARALAEIQHGYITLVVQDGQVVQIDCTQKLRLRGETQPVAGAHPGSARRSQRRGSAS